MKKLVPMLDFAGYFERPAPAYESPLEPGVYHIPAGCVDAPVPDVPPGERAKWTGSGFVFEAAPLPPPPPVEPPKTPEDIAAEKVARIQQKALEALPDILAYIAAQADAPIAVKDKAAELVAVKVVK